MRAALAKRGVLVYDPASMELAPNIQVVFLDKTGTLTDPSQGQLEELEGSPKAVAQTRALLRASGHMLGKLVTEPVSAVAELKAYPGLGVSGSVDEVKGRAGRPEWVFSDGSSMPESIRALVEKEDASLIAGVSEDGDRCLLRLRQTLREGVESAVDQLRRGGKSVEILSGDRPRAVEVVAEKLKVPARAGLLPEGKVARILELRESGALVMMAGDGVNDGPALRAADLSFAMSDGTAVARSEAQVELVGRTLNGLPLFFEGARLLRSTIRGNLFWTVAYNCVAIGLAYSGKLHPLAAVSAMIASSIMISVRSVKLLNFGESLTLLPPVSLSEVRDSDRKAIPVACPE
jgi:P-type E1-E2 ATPase